ncbi:uncharacterized protein LOC130769289 [Actinidia eriantha]|uniref:uncharacterized protein LOC130769289 n=1 Tax=Actinidia eriantha TaxID=165200 RepID=UPI00258E3861|nr:uncharacterized protein LOC130769289 [Actinidia eriantha]
MRGAGGCRSLAWHVTSIVMLFSSGGSLEFTNVGQNGANKFIDLSEQCTKNIAPGMQIGAEQVDEMVSKAEDHTSEVGGDHQIDELVLTEAEQPSTEIQDTHGKVGTSQSMLHFILGAHICYVLHF